MSHPVEITWYRALVLIASAMGIAIGISSLYFFNRIRLNGQCSPVSESTATTMVWLNLFLAIFSAIAFFWSLFRLIFSGHDSDVVNQSFNLHTHLHDSADTVVVSPPTSPISVLAEQGYQV